MSDDISTDVVAPSSSAPDTTAPPEPSPAPDSNAPSSGATDDKSPSSGDSRQSDRDGLLAVVQKVVDVKPETPALPSDDVEPGDDGPAPQDQVAATGGAQPPPDVTTELPDPTEADMKKWRPETRRRFEQVLAQRNEARQQFASVQPELEEFRQLRGHFQEAQLAPDDINQLLYVGSELRRGNYQAFLNGVMPFVLAAQEAIGVRVASDLQTQVDQGLIDEATARDLTRTRHRAAQAEARLQETNQVMAATRQQQHTDGIRASVDVWEARVRQVDPDYPIMSDAVRRYAQGLVQERGQPRSQQEAVALVQTAYDEVKAQQARWRPPPQATRPSPSSIHVATGTAQRQPRNIDDVVRMTIADMRRAS